MIPARLSRMATRLLMNDYSDAEFRNQIKTNIIPELRQYRREVLTGIFVGRHQRADGFIAKHIADSLFIRKVLSHAHTSLMGYQSSNVVYLQQAREKRMHELLSA